MAVDTIINGGGGVGVNLDNIPAELQQYQYWCNWRYEQKPDKDKPDKIPYHPLTAQRAKSNDPATFAPFSAVKQTLAGNAGYSGVGVGLFGNMAAVDIDNCIDSATMQINELARDAISTMNTYTEISPSGCGLRLFFTAPGFQYDKDRYYINKRAIGLEVYVAGNTQKFVTVTGNVYGFPLPIADGSTALPLLLEKYMRRNKTTGAATAELPPAQSLLTDEEVIAKAHTAKGADKFAQLWNGDTNGYPSQSEADLALCNLLAFWCGGDTEQMDRIFRMSGLYREKWDEHPTYRTDTLDKAVRDCTTFYRQGNTAAEDFAGLVSFIDPTSDKNRYRPHDIGNGYLFADSFKNSLRYSPDKKQWMVYDGTRWTNAYGDGVARERAKQLSQALWKYAHLYEGEAQKAFTKNAGLLQSVSKREAMLKDASTVYPLTADRLDANASLFNCLNGTLNLHTLEFKPHSPDDLLSKIAGVRYDPTAHCPLWEKTIADIFPGKPDLSLFIQTWSGYTITGNPKEECLTIFYGATTRNGKGTIISTLAALFGDYCMSAAPETLEVRQNRDSSKPSEDLARLAGARMVSISEPDKSMHFDAAKVKTLTGRDIITARNLHERSFEYVPQFSITINTNHRPKITDNSLFSSGRIHLLPFERHFTEHEQDKELKDKLRDPQEMSGILNWILEGLRRYRSAGLNPPAAVKAATAEYQYHSDKLAQFLDECTEPDAHGAVPTSTLYTNYQGWCSRNGLRFESLKNFSLDLKSKGYESDRKRFDGGNPAMCFLGLKIK